MYGKITYNRSFSEIPLDWTCIDGSFVHRIAFLMLSCDFHFDPSYNHDNHTIDMWNFHGYVGYSHLYPYCFVLINSNFR